MREASGNLDDDGETSVAFPFAQGPEWGEAVEVAPGVLWLRMPLSFPPRHVNVLALADDAANGGGWTIVDTGCGAEAREMWQAVLSGPLAGRPVTRLIGTHHHLDHIGLAGWFQNRGADLWMSRTAWLMARMLTLDVQERPSAEYLDFLRRAGVPAVILADRAGKRPFNYADHVDPMPLGLHSMSEGQIVRIGGRNWRVALGSGHAPDHVTLWSLDDDLVIGGDQLLPGISPNLGVYPTEPLADPVGDWIRSSARLAGLANDRQLVLPGHEMPFTGLPARLAGMIRNHENALDRLEAALAASPRTVVDCFGILFRRPIDASTYPLALVEAVGHVNNLVLNGRAAAVGMTEDGGVLWGVTAAA